MDQSFTTKPTLGMSNLSFSNNEYLSSVVIDSSNQ